MAIQRAIFAVTADSNGQGYADVTLKLPSTLTRHAHIVDISVDVHQAYLIKTPTVTISSLDDESLNIVPTAEAAGTTYALGDQLVFIDLQSVTESSLTYPSRDEVYAFSPTHYAVLEAGGAPSTAVSVAQTIIRKKKARCEVFGGGSGDIYTVNLYYETAGDFRF